MFACFAGSFLGINENVSVYRIFSDLQSMAMMEMITSLNSWHEHGSLDNYGEI